MSNDIYTWSNDMYPLVKKRFDDRYASRMNLIGNVCGIVKQNELSYERRGSAATASFRCIPEARFPMRTEARAFSRR